MHGTVAVVDVGVVVGKVVAVVDVEVEVEVEVEVVDVVGSVVAEVVDVVVGCGVVEEEVDGHTDVYAKQVLNTSSLISLVLHTQSGNVKVAHIHDDGFSGTEPIQSSDVAAQTT